MELKKHAIDWCILIKPDVLCSRQKSTSEKMSSDSIQNWPPQLTLIESS